VRIAERDADAPLPLSTVHAFSNAFFAPVTLKSITAPRSSARPGAMALIGLARLLSNRTGGLRLLRCLRPYTSSVLVEAMRCSDLAAASNGSTALQTHSRLQQGLALESTNTNAQLYRGRLLRQLGRTDEAIEAWREVCTRSPQNADAWYELVFMLASASAIRKR